MTLITQEFFPTAEHLERKVRDVLGPPDSLGQDRPEDSVERPHSRAQWNGGVEQVLVEVRVGQLQEYVSQLLSQSMFILPGPTVREQRSIAG